MTCPPPRFATPAAGVNAAELARHVRVAAVLGYDLMDWQRMVLERVCGRHRQVTWLVPRQSGKSVCVLAAMVARCLKAPGQRVVYGAQNRQAAAGKLIDDWWRLLERSPLGPSLRLRRQNGSEAVLFSNGSMISLLSGTLSSGHGQTVHLAVLDEAWALADSRAEAALRPAMVTVPDAQLLICSTAGTGLSVYLRAKVDSGRAAASMGLDTAQAFLEWSAPDGADPDDPAVWRTCMPALGETIDETTIAEDRQLMDDLEWQRAYLNRWTGTAAPWSVIPGPAWAALADPSAAIRPVDKRSFGVSVAPDRTAAAVAVAGPVDGGRILVEVESYLPETAWVAGRVAQLHAAWRPSALVIDPGSLAAPLIPDIQLQRVPLTTPFTARDAAQACGLLGDYVTSGRLCHRAQPELDASVQAAKVRPLSGGDGWDVRDPALTCLSAASLALWGHVTYGASRTAPYDLLRSVAG